VNTGKGGPALPQVLLDPFNARASVEATPIERMPTYADEQNAAESKGF
jgi:hypothetical protein